MASFDYDVIVVGSGFGGSVAAMRAIEKGYSVGVLEAGRRWRGGSATAPLPTYEVRKVGGEVRVKLGGAGS